MRYTFRLHSPLLFVQESQIIGRDSADTARPAARFAATTATAAAAGTVATARTAPYAATTTASSRCAPSPGSLCPTSPSSSPRERTFLARPRTRQAIFSQNIRTCFVVPFGFFPLIHSCRTTSSSPSASRRCSRLTSCTAIPSGTRAASPPPGRPICSERRKTRTAGTRSSPAMWSTWLTGQVHDPHALLSGSDVLYIT